MQFKYISYYFIMFYLFYSCNTLPDFKEKGWQKSENNSPEIIESYSFLKEKLNKVNSKITLTEIIEAKMQNVGGYNILLLCVYHNENESQKFLKALIYKDLDNIYYLRTIKYNINF
ncbi:MAG: hypothetical protein OEZ22_00560 [Spirochaetia bacterium]|nr:hypothetical protein [Spirochaetia bacterium]